MKEHAIPQDVTGYRFHIVGNMTLAQFGQLVVGALICFGLYQTNLYGALKYPLLFFVVLISVVAAFIPIAERPLSHWIKTFAMVLYKPTQFAWRRVAHIPEPFLFKPEAETGPVLPELDLTPLRRKRIQEFISTTHMAAGVDEESVQMDQYYEHVFSLFTTQKTHVDNLLAPIQVNKPSLRVRTRSMRANPSTPLGLETALTETETHTTDTIQAETSPDVVNSGAFSTNRTVELEALAAAQTPAGVVIPLAEPPTVEPAAEEVAQVSAADGAMLGGQALVQQQPPKEQTTSGSVVFNTELPFPSKPTAPNKLVGMVLTAQNELIEGAIVEIRKSDGQVERAVRTNALGQFYVTTPLANGDYVVVVEKAGKQFAQLSIKLKGKIVDPIEIHSM